MLDIKLGDNLELMTAKNENDLRKQKTVLIAFFRKNGQQKIFYKNTAYKFTYSGPETEPKIEKQEAIIHFNEDLIRRVKAKKNLSNNRKSKEITQQFKLNVFDADDPKFSSTTTTVEVGNFPYSLSKKHYKVTLWNSSSKIDSMEIKTVAKSRKIRVIHRRKKESESDFEKRVTREVRYHKQFTRYDDFTDENFQVIYEGDNEHGKLRAILCMKYLYGINLFEAVENGIIDKFSDVERLEFAKLFIQLLKPLHKNGVIHHDLHSSNVLIKHPASKPRSSIEQQWWNKQPKLMLLDFETAATKDAHQNEARSVLIKFSHKSCAPELFSPSYKQLLSTEFDLYPAAFILAKILYGKSATATQSEGALVYPKSEKFDKDKRDMVALFEKVGIAAEDSYRLVINNNVKRSSVYPKEVNKQLLKLFRSMQSFKAKNRYNVDEVFEKLNQVEAYISKKKRANTTIIRH